MSETEPLSNIPITAGSEQRISSLLNPHQYHLDQNKNHGPLPTSDEVARYKGFPKWLDNFFSKYKVPVAVGTGTAATMVAAVASATENVPTIEAATVPENTTSNTLSSLLAEIQVPKDPVNSFFLSNVPGTELSGNPENVPGFIDFDNRPGPEVAYFNIPGAPKAPEFKGYGVRTGVNSLVFDGATNKVLFMDYYVSLFPGDAEGKHRLLSLEQIKSQYGDPDLPPKVSAEDPNYLLINYASKGYVFFTGNFGHDGAENFVYRIQSFQPTSAGEYYDSWGYRENTGFASVNGK